VGLEERKSTSRFCFLGVEWIDFRLHQHVGEHQVSASIRIQAKHDAEGSEQGWTNRKHKQILKAKRHDEPEDHADKALSDALVSLT
jgi:hypothetical protein